MCYRLGVRCDEIVLFVAKVDKTGLERAKYVFYQVNRPFRTSVMNYDLLKYC